jgi:hypothetical protein
MSVPQGDDAELSRQGGGGAGRLAKLLKRLPMPLF